MGDSDEPDGSLSVLNLGVQTYVGNRLIAFHIRGETAQGTADLHAGCAVSHFVHGRDARTVGCCVAGVRDW